MAKMVAGSSSSSYWKKLNKGDSPYARAKHVQMVDKDPNKAIALFWAAINSRDRVDSALKDMAVAMRQVNRAAEAIEAIKSFRGFCSYDAQETLDNLLLDLYKNCGRIDDYVGLLKFKLKLIDERLAFGGRPTKEARFQGKKNQASINRQKSRLLGTLAWAYVQCEKYEEAEPLYWQALAIEPNYNKQCNLAICLMMTGKLSEAKSLLQLVPSPYGNFNAGCYLKAFNHASKLLKELESQSTPNGKKEEIKMEAQRVASLAGSPNIISNNFSSPSPSKFFTPQPNFKRYSPVSVNENISGSYISQERRTWADVTDEEEEFKTLSVFNKENHETPTRGRADLQKMECPVWEENQKPILPILENDLLSQGSEAMEGIKNGYAANDVAKASDKQSTGLVFMEKIPFHSWKNDGSLMSSFAAAVTESLNQNEPPLVEEEKEERKAIGVNKKIYAPPILNNGRRSWADMVEEEEKELANLKLNNGETELFGDENVNSNILPSNSQYKQWKSENCTEKLSERINLVDLNVGSEECRARPPRRDSSARRYLSLNERHGIWS